MMRLGILSSTRGTILLSLLDAIHQKSLAAEIAMVVSNKKDALILEKAKTHQLPALFLDGDDFDDKVTQAFEEKAVDLIILIGYMRILSNAFVTRWANRVINIHPSLLPQFAGKMDLDVHQAVIDAKLKQTGCTVHYVTEAVDEGPVILQKKCIVLSGDNAERLKARVQELEASALIEVIKKIGREKR